MTSDRVRRKGETKEQDTLVDKLYRHIDLSSIQIYKAKYIKQ